MRQTSENPKATPSMTATIPPCAPNLKNSILGPLPECRRENRLWVACLLLPPLSVGSRQIPHDEVQLHRRSFLPPTKFSGARNTGASLYQPCMHILLFVANVLCKIPFVSKCWGKELVSHAFWFRIIYIKSYDARGHVSGIL